MLRTRRTRGPAAAIACLIAGLALAAPGTAAAATSAKLLAKYQPVTRFADGEQFTPTAVEEFVADANLERLEAGGFVVADATPDASSLPTSATTVWRLNQRTCSPLQPIGGLDCYGAALSGDEPSIVYGRVARLDDRVVLQYWYFYYDDVYSYQVPPTDFIWQAHEGDWEVVNVVLSEDEQPLFVGYSQHCTGQRRTWAAAPRFQGHHPIVYVALGSHANYPDPSSHAIAPSCLPDQAISLFQQSGLPLPIDRTGSASQAGPAAAGGPTTRIRRITGQTPAWVGYPGAWGELEVFHAPSPFGSVPAGLGPVGPTFHSVWRHPLVTLASWSNR